MPIGFLAPLFLVALGALAVPILIHLIQKERKEAIVFPSLMFIAQVPYKSTHRRRIRNWLLFVLRCAALVLLVGAFARPWVDRELSSTGALATAREVVILVDRSWSMGWGDHWERALTAARSAVDALGSEDRATIVYFDGGASVANQPTRDAAQLRAALDSARVGAGATRYSPAIKMAQGVLEESTLPRREVILISDFQRTGWDGEEGTRMPAGTKITPVAIVDSATANVAITGVSFRREPAGDRERVIATARLTSRSGDAIRGLPVALELDGREIQKVNVDIGENDAASVTFQPFTLGEDELRGTVRAPGDRLSADDRFHFVLAPGQSLDVLIVDGGGSQSTLYLERALAIGESPPMRVEVRRAAQFRAGDLTDRDVVVLNDAAFPTGSAGQRLREFVVAGGGLIIALGPRNNSSGWGEGAGLVPGTPGSVVDRERGASLGYIDYSHPVFEPFRAPRSGDLSSPRIFRYRPVMADSTASILARFDDGGAALVGTTAGNGRVLVWGTTLDNFWTDLPVRPVYLPLVHQLVRYASGYAEPSPWFTAGQVLDVYAGRVQPESDSAGAPADRSGARDGNATAIAPGGERQPVPASGLLVLAEQGFYEVRGAGARGDFTVAVNLDFGESDLTAMDPHELTAALEPRGDAARVTAVAQVRPEDRERRQSLWWYLLLAAFLILATETALSNRLSRRATAVTQ
ncbi:MAG: BatA domain-containing protein [Gemmatimonadetes bacterium]|nr:BatA domain-containing protein [Gemmatimonadota bacterium]